LICDFLKYNFLINSPFTCLILMKIIIASNSFKGCCSSLDAAAAFEKGVLRAAPESEIVKIAVADGGEGTVDALIAGLSGDRCSVSVSGPTGDKVNALYGIINSTTAIIEMAAASGLTLIPECKQDPLYTSTYGTGELILDALRHGCRKIVIGIGGSATNDGGMGMAQALGVLFLDKNGSPLGSGAIELGKLDKIDCSMVDKRLCGCEVVALCDVANPLTGPDGASYVYGPQKGAHQSELYLLDANMIHFADVIKKQLGKDVLDIPGGGAAGGLGAGLIAFCNAKLQSGIETILGISGLESHLVNADLVITGEGRIDRQTAFGKVPAGVAGIAKKHGVPVIAIVGSIGDGAQSVYSTGVDSILSIVRSPMTLNDSIRDFPILAADAAERLMRIVMAFRK